MTFFKRAIILCTVIIGISAPFSSSCAEVPVEEEVIIPSPLTLSLNWWIAFDVAEADFKQKISDLKGELYSVRDAVDEDKRERISSLISTILSNLTTLHEIRSRDNGQAVESLVLKETYTIEEQLKLSREIVNKKGSLKILDADYNRKLRKADDINSRIDKLFLDYLGYEDPSHEKIFLGFAIMVQRSELQILREEADYLKDRIDFQKEALEDVNSVLDSAQRRLYVEDVDFKDIEDDIALAKKSLENAEKSLVKAESSTMMFSGNDEISRLKQRGQQRKVTNALIEKHLSASTLDFLNAKYLLLDIYAHEDVRSLENIERDVQEHRIRLDNNKILLEEWQDATLHEQIIFGQMFTGLRETQGSDKDVLEDIFEDQLELIQGTFSRMAQLDLLNYNIEVVLQQVDYFVEKNSSYFENVISNIGSWIEDVNGVVREWLFLTIFKINKEVPVTPASFLMMFLILIVAYFISKAFRHMLVKVTQKRSGISESNVYALKRIVHYVVMIIGFFIAIGSIGLNFSNLAIILGALSVGIGFGLQSIVNNFLSGLIILFEKSIKVGDYVKLESGDWGKVIAVNVHNTIIHTYDGTDIIVPNAEVVTHNVINWTLYNKFMRIHIPFSVAYGTDKDLVKEAALEAAGRVPATIKDNPRVKDPDVWFVEFGDSALKFELIVWVDIKNLGNQGSFKSAYMWELETSLREHNITVPFSQHDLYIKEIPDSVKKRLVDKTPE